jgi:hypothetical protein
MWGKLPGGSAGSVPSGSASAASGTGVPHHGGAISAWAGAAATTVTSVTVATNPASRERGDIDVPPMRTRPGRRASVQARDRSGDRIDVDDRIAIDRSDAVLQPPRNGGELSEVEGYAAQRKPL